MNVGRLHEVILELPLPNASGSPSSEHRLATPTPPPSHLSAGLTSLPPPASLRVIGQRAHDAAANRRVGGSRASRSCL
eukprot:399208-Hanusia_phi.AAC.1